MQEHPDRGYSFCLENDTVNVVLEERYCFSRKLPPNKPQDNSSWTGGL